MLRFHPDKRPEILTRLIERDGPYCMGITKEGKRCLTPLYLLKPIDIHIHHIIPIERAGERDAEDISIMVALCRSCHSIATVAEEKAYANQSTIESPVCESRSVDSLAGSKKRKKLTKGAYDVARRQSETSAQRANHEREWRFVDWLIESLWNGAQFTPEDFIDAGAHLFGGSPVAYTRYWNKLQNPINGPLTILYDGGKPYVGYKSDRFANAKENFFNGKCCFCASDRNEGKAMCDACIDRYRQNE
jgi:hypothetical protein